MIGVCYTKASKLGFYLADALVQGFPNTVKVTLENYLEILPQCTKFIHICYPNFWKINRFPNGRIYKFLLEIQKYVTDTNCLYIETAFIRSQLHYEFGQFTDLEKIYYSIGTGGVKNKANYYNINSPSDRFDKLEIDIPKQNVGNYNLIIGQAFRGISTQDINIHNWYIKIYGELLQKSKLPIAFKPHPKTYASHKDRLQLQHFLNTNLSTLEYDENVSMRGANAVVSFSSNATIDALLKGIPVYTFSPINIAWPIAHHDLESINQPYLPDYSILYRFFSDLAYAQWSISEIRSGQVAEKFKTFCDL